MSANNVKRKVLHKAVGYKTKDGAGVNLVRVLGSSTVKEFDLDPFLMLDSFDSTNPEDYTAGFPMHPHRGIETISFVSRGKMQHKDTLGFEDTITDGEVQFMTAGSGVEHEELIPATEQLRGLQLWLNLPSFPVSRADCRVAAVRPRMNYFPARIVGMKSTHPT